MKSELIKELSLKTTKAEFNSKTALLE